MLARVDPWSVMKLSFLLADRAGGRRRGGGLRHLWSVLDTMGVFDSVGRTVESVTRSSDNAAGRRHPRLRRAEQGALADHRCWPAVNVVLMTALCTLAAFLYNMAASLVGGLHVTFTEDV